MNQKLLEMLSDEEAVEGVINWLQTQDQTVNVGDERIESSAGWVVRLLKSRPKTGNDFEAATRVKGLEDNA